MRGGGGEELEILDIRRTSLPSFMAWRRGMGGGGGGGRNWKF